MKEGEFDRWKQWSLPFILALLGFVFSTRTWILTLDSFNPVSGLFIYYIILTITLLALQYFGLIIDGVSFTGWRHLFGSILIIFSFFIVVDWTSCYDNLITKGNCDQLSSLFLSSEDGAVYYLWNKIFPDPEMCRYLTYVLTPFVLSSIGILLITEKVRISAF